MKKLLLPLVLLTHSLSALDMPVWFYPLITTYGIIQICKKFNKPEKTNKSGSLRQGKGIIATTFPPHILINFIR